MNATVKIIHPATLGEAIMRVEVALRESMRNRGISYGMITDNGGSLSISPPDRHGLAKKTFRALQDFCRSLAPTLGADVAPSAIEITEGGVQLHFGDLPFGNRPRPSVLVATDLEVTLDILQRASLQDGPDSWHLIPTDDGTILSHGVDKADACLRWLGLTGQLSGLPYLPMGQTCLPFENRHGIDPSMIRTLEVRLDRGISALRHAAE